MLKFDFDKLEEIGCGSFATVYQHPTEPDKIIKVIEGTYSYLKFLDIYRHTLNSRPNWAKIFNMEFNKDKWVIVQEKIPRPITTKQYDFKKSWRKALKTKTNPDLKELVWLLNEICSRHSLNYDVHSQNIGLRADGTVAIFDPWC